MSQSSDIVDILIVGAGAAGAAVAHSLADTRMRILCLEQGDWVRSTEYPTNGRDWESRPDFSGSPNVRRRPADYPIDDSESPIKPVNFNGVGGGTILYMAHFPRLHPSDFRTRSLDGVGEDWPITYADLEPHFAANDQMMGVAGLPGDPGCPPKDGLLPPVPLGTLGRLRWFNCRDCGITYHCQTGARLKTTSMPHQREGDRYGNTRRSRPESAH